MLTEAIDVLQMEREIKKREKLVEDARDIIEKNEKNLENALQEEGVSLSFLDVARNHLTDKEKDTLKKMYDTVQQEICRMAEEKWKDAPPIKGTKDGVQKEGVLGEVPLDVALKGGFAAAGDKKLRKKKKKDWV